MKSDVMRVYYNEWDEPTAEWLRQLCAGHHLPAGHVDTRSIRDVRAGDVRGYDQAHFFAGIGGWPLALRLAGYEHLPCWTGSPPCQPFSVAGQRRGNDDERHLAPVWLDLVRERKPPVLLGEQVEAAIRHGWLDDLFDALEAEGYACGAAVLPACSVGAPHIRKRLFFGAVRLDDAAGARCFGPLAGPEGQAWDKARMCVPGAGCTDGRLADPVLAGRSEGRAGSGRRPIAGGISTDGLADAPILGRIGRRSGETCDEPGSVERSDGLCDTGRLAHSDDTRPQGRQRVPECPDEQPAGARSLESGSAHSDHGGWSGADWLGCRDGKFRPVEPGTQPLASGLPARVGRLRGYGNAIVPAVAAVFIKEFLGAFAEIQENTGG